MALLAASQAAYLEVLTAALHELVKSFIETQFLELALRAKVEDENSADMIVASAKRRELMGVGSRTDTLQATAALLRATLNKNRAQSDYDRSVSALRILLDIDMGSKVNLEAEPIPHPKVLKKNLHYWMTQLKKSNQSLIAARHEETAAHAQIAIIKSENRPRIDFFADMQKNDWAERNRLGASTSQVSIGVTLSIPIFHGFQHSHRIKSAAALAEMQNANVREAERRLSLELTQAYFDSVSAAENLQVSEDLYDVSSDAFDSVRRKFDGGAADMLALINANTILSESRQERIRSAAALKLSVFNLMKISGRLDRDNI